MSGLWAFSFVWFGSFALVPFEVSAKAASGLAIKELYPSGLGRPRRWCGSVNQVSFRKEWNKFGLLLAGLRNGFTARYWLGFYDGVLQGMPRILSSSSCLTCCT